MRREDRPARARPLVAGAAERIGAIVEAAERAAESVIDDAEEQARRYLEQARADADREAAARRAGESESIDSLLEQAEALRAQAERLVAALEGAREEIGPDPAGRRGGGVEWEGEEPAPRVAPIPPRRRPRLAAAADPEQERSNYAGARLLATQMAVSGSSREEIELRLTSGFGIEDPAAILDAILGPED